MVNRPLDAVRSPGRTVATRVRGLRSWRGAIGLGGVAAGAIMITGAFLPWVTTFAGLIAIPGVRGSNGRMLAGAGAVIALAGIAHALRGGRWSRWVIGLAGFLATGFSGFLLLQLAASLRSLSSDSMVAGQAGPGLWVTAAGSALAFATMFLPASAQDATADRDNSPGLRAWAADFGSTGLRRGLQITLGVLWLADGAFQLQPFMFGRGFVNQILVPAYMGSPAGVTGPALAFTRLILHAPAAWNAAFAITQLLLGAALLWRPTVRAALAGTIAWALAVWWFGESLGGVLSGMASPLTGAPGAVILYALLAVLAWPRASTLQASPWAGRRGQPAGPDRSPGRVAGPVGQFRLFHPAGREPGARRGAGHVRRPRGRGTGLDRRDGPGHRQRRERPRPRDQHRPGGGFRCGGFGGVLAGQHAARTAAERARGPGHLGARGELRRARDRAGHGPQHRPAPGGAGRGVLAAEPPPGRACFGWS